MKTKWLIQSSIGLVLTGAGLCLAIDAGFEKFQGNPWVLYGTAALVVFNSGLCLTIDAGLRYAASRAQNRKSGV
jgi:hypothetical protein